MDHVVAPPYGLGQSTRDRDYAYARELEEKIFPGICEVLNRYHGTRHGVRFWRIVLGHWVRVNIEMLTNRVRTVQECVRSYRLSGTTVHASGDGILLRATSQDAYDSYLDDRWNHAIYVRILRLLGHEDAFFEAETPSVFRDEATCLPPVEARGTLRRIKSTLYRFASWLTPFFVRDTDGFVITSYLPRAEEFKLHLVLGQFPQIWRLNEFSPVACRDERARERLAQEIEGGSVDELEMVVRATLFDLMPICYLEGFGELTREVALQPWPRSPRFIFTSNRFYMDEVFKLWTASNVEKGIRYIVGQHGNNYGTHRYNHPTVEELTCDKFVTWGWKEEPSRYLPAFILKTAGRRARSARNDGGLLLVQSNASGRAVTWDEDREYGKWMDDLMKFVESLRQEARRGLTIRLHPRFRVLGKMEDLVWADFDSRIAVDRGGGSLNGALERSRLVVHGYDSTGILETFSLNIPTLAFLPSGFVHLRDSAVPYYQTLVDSGLIHFTAESLADKVNEIWDDVGAWWSQDRVRYAREQFCSQYARSVPDPLRHLRNLLTAP